MCDKDTRLAKTRTQTKHLILRLQDEVPRVYKSMFVMKASILSKCDFIHCNHNGIQKMALLTVVQGSFVISMYQFVDKLILPLFFVHTVFIMESMILSLLCALSPLLPPLVSEGANERSYYS